MSKYGRRNEAVKNSILTIALVLSLALLCGIKSYAGVNDNNITCMITTGQAISSSGYGSMPIDRMYGQTNMASKGPIHFFAQARLIASGITSEAGYLNVPVNQSNTTSVDDYYNFYQLTLMSSVTNGAVNQCIGWGELYEH